MSIKLINFERNLKERPINYLAHLKNLKKNEFDFNLSKQTTAVFNRYKFKMVYKKAKFSKFMDKKRKNYLSYRRNKIYLKKLRIKKVRFYYRYLSRWKFYRKLKKRIYLKKRTFWFINKIKINLKRKRVIKFVKRVLIAPKNKKLNSKYFIGKLINSRKKKMIDKNLKINKIDKKLKINKIDKKLKINKIDKKLKMKGRTKNLKMKGRTKNLIGRKLLSIKFKKSYYNFLKSKKRRLYSFYKYKKKRFYFFHEYRYKSKSKYRYKYKYKRKKFNEILFFKFKSFKNKLRSDRKSRLVLKKKKKRKTYIGLKYKFLNKYKKNAPKFLFKSKYKSSYYLEGNHLLPKRKKFLFFYLRGRKVKSSPNTLFSKFKNFFLRKGLGNKKEKMFDTIIIYLKLLLKEKGLKVGPMEFINRILKNISFYCELRKKRIGSIEVLVPTPINSARGFFLGFKLLLANAKLRPEKSCYALKIAKEIVETDTQKSSTYREVLKYNKTVNQNLENIRFVQLSSFKV